MAQTRKTASQTRKTATRPRPPAASGEPFLRFHFPAALHKKVLGIVEKLEASPDPTKHRSALADAVVELTRCGMDAYFMQPLKLAKAGFITEQTASLGMAGAVQVLSSVIRNIVGGMATPQLLSVSRSMRQFMQ